MSKPQPTVHDFPILLFYSQADQCWIADVPDLKHCSAFGDSPEQAVREISVAIALSLDSLRQLGRPLPRPRFGASARRAIVTESRLSA